MPDTNYIILRRISHPQDSPGAHEQWERCTEVEAHSTEAAVRKGATHLPDEMYEPHVFVAVPTRNWKPVTVKAEQTITLKLDPA